MSPTLYNQQRLKIEPLFFIGPMSFDGVNYWNKVDDDFLLEFERRIADLPIKSQFDGSGSKQSHYVEIKIWQKLDDGILESVKKLKIG